MKTIVITDKNYRWVFSRLKKFFDHENFVCWHQWGGGMRKRLGHIVEIRRPDMPAYKTNVTRRYYQVRTRIYLDIPEKPLFHVTLDFDSGLGLIPGDAVAFLGNRIIIRTWNVALNQYLYECFQILK